MFSHGSYLFIYFSEVISRDIIFIVRWRFQRSLALWKNLSQTLFQRGIIAACSGEPFLASSFKWARMLNLGVSQIALILVDRWGGSFSLEGSIFHRSVEVLDFFPFVKGLIFHNFIQGVTTWDRLLEKPMLWLFLTS